VGPRGLALLERAPGVTAAAIQEVTEPRLEMAGEVPEMRV
jgi:hypothetical protein